MKKTKQKGTDRGTLLLFIGFCIGLLGGILFGMISQQMILTVAAVEIAEGFEGSEINVEVDFNETQIIEGYTEFLEEVIVPVLKEEALKNE